MPPTNPVPEPMLDPLGATLESDGELKIDNRPALEDQYKQAKERLDSALDQIKAQDLVNAVVKVEARIKKAQELANPSESDREYLERDKNLELALQTLMSVQETKNREAVLSLSAKNDVMAFSKLIGGKGVGGSPDLGNDTIESAVYLLQQAVENLAGSRFTEELKAQVETEREKNKDRLNATKEELSKLNVS